MAKTFVRLEAVVTMAHAAGAKAIAPTPPNTEPPMKNVIQWLKLIGIVLAFLLMISCSFYLDKVRFCL